MSEQLWSNEKFNEIKGVIKQLFDKYNPNNDERAISEKEFITDIFRAVGILVCHESFSKNNTERTVDLREDLEKISKKAHEFSQLIQRAKSDVIMHLSIDLDTNIRLLDNASPSIVNNHSDLEPEKDQFMCLSQLLEDISIAGKKAAKFKVIFPKTDRRKYSVFVTEVALLYKEYLGIYPTELGKEEIKRVDRNKAWSGLFVDLINYAIPLGHERPFETQENKIDEVDYKKWVFDAAKKAIELGN